MHQFGDKLTGVIECSCAKYKNTIMVCPAVLAHLQKGYPNHFKFIKSVTNSILLAGYCFLTKTVLKDIPNESSGSSSDIHFFVQCCMSHSRSQVQNIHFLLQNTKYISEMSSDDSSEAKISEATYNNLLKDGYCSSNKGNYTPHTVRWETHLFDIKTVVSIPLHMDQINPLLLITDICRELHVGHSLISNKVSPCLIPLINRVISKCNAIATLVYPDGISKLQFIDALTFDFLTV